VNDDPARTSGRHSAYFDAMRDADETLDDALGHVRAEEDAGRITPAEAAAERVGLLERHIAECQRLRREMLGSEIPTPQEDR
jgi:hypothetical protein